MKNSECNQPVCKIFKELNNKLPWLVAYSAFITSSNEGYDGNTFGSRAGAVEDTNVYNVLHEVSHAIELTLLRTQDWHRRIKIHNFGMRIKSYQTVMGINYYEPATTQATERECRVGGIQLRLLEAAGFNVTNFAQEYALILKYLPDANLGVSVCPCTAQKYDKFTIEEKEWVHFRIDLVMQAYDKFTLADIKERWHKIMTYKNSLK